MRSDARPGRASAARLTVAHARKYTSLTYQSLISILFLNDCQNSVIFDKTLLRFGIK